MAALIAATSVCWMAPAEAQTRYREPAEFPPVSFQGSQYVDSRGCIFVRAGISGATTWVPRVTATRQNICGARPSLADGVSAQTTATGPGTIPRGATLITAPPATGTASASASAPATGIRPATSRAVAQPMPRAQANARAAAPVNARVAPMPPVAAARPGAPMQTIASITTPPTIGATAEARARAAARQAAGAGGCPAGVRCGPQAQDPVPRGTTTAAVPAARTRPALVSPAPGTVVHRRDLATLAPQTRIAPRHVAEAQAQTTQGIAVPNGYRPVWEDDRLNPRRAIGTVAGQRAMELVWTDTVPRRLIDRRTGRDMTAQNPNLRYPYTDLTTQVRDAVPARPGATISTAGKGPTQVQRAAAPVVSTRAVPAPQAAPVQRVAGRFVQVGAFADQGNADAAIRRLQAAGLPVSVQRTSSRGRPVQVILAGPFADPAALSQGLGAARSAGFGDAFPRN